MSSILSRDKLVHSNSIQPMENSPNSADDWKTQAENLLQTNCWSCCKNTLADQMLAVEYYSNG